ncbi:MAG: hypothetical protein LH614_15100 [Pyrinomonadaceae bacterium]|nr:hypothetical protein [Pyrinomonadaceae bacterium]
MKKITNSIFPLFCVIGCLLITNCSTPDSSKIENSGSSQIIPTSSAQSNIGIKKIELKEEVVPIKLGETEIKVVVNKSSVAFPVYLYFNMHDNENTAVEATKEIISKNGGTLIELQADGQRLIKFSLNKKQYTFDPNRIFTDIGIKKTLDNYGDYAPEAQKEVSNFANKLAKDYFQNSKLLVAVHNNTEGNYSIKSYEKGQEFGNDAKLVFINPNTDADDFFFVTEEKFYKLFSEKNYNVALQDNEKVTDDGSLSVYCGYKKISYINVESEHNHLKEQVKMLEVLQDLIKNL